MADIRNDPSRSSPHGLTVADEAPASFPCQLLLKDLIGGSLILEEDWDALPGPTRDALMRCPDMRSLLSGFVEHKLLTDYQAAQISVGKTFGLVLGNYRVLERLGSGAMGVVFKAEHRRLRRPVAI